LAGYLAGHFPASAVCSLSTGYLLSIDTKKIRSIVRTKPPGATLISKSANISAKYRNENA
jgi:hypothetical protein